jgi:RNA polymerase sigma-70 factor (ECF subfamily)
MRDREESRTAAVIGYNPAILPSCHAAMQSPDDIPADIALLDRIVARDASAIGELYDRYSRLLYGLILRILNDRAEAEEVLQEAFFLVWTRAETYNGSLGSPAAWLVRIGRNRAIDRLRANSVRARAVEVAPPPGPSPVDVDSPEWRATVSERQRAVARALEVLAPEQRALIEQAYFLGMTQSELAERFQMPLGTVKTKIRNGMMVLREQLQQMVIEQ